MVKSTRSKNFSMKRKFYHLVITRITTSSSEDVWEKNKSKKEGDNKGNQKYVEKWIKWVIEMIFNDYKKQSEKKKIL